MRKTTPKARRRAGELRKLTKAAFGLPCAAKSADCTGRGIEFHHKTPRKRGGSDDLGNLLWVCRACHDWIHASPELSHKLGVLISPKISAQLSMASEGLEPIR